MYVIHWLDNQTRHAALVIAELSMAEAIARRLAGATITTTTKSDVQALVAARDQIRQVPPDVLAQINCTILIDPSRDDRIEVLRIQGGRTEARLFYIDAPSTVSTAEHGLLLILALTRRLFHAYSGLVSGVRRPGVRSWLTDDSVSEPNWVSVDEPDLIYGKTLGIIGLGRTGTALAGRARAFGMRIIYHDIHRQSIAEERYGARRRRFNQLLRESDIVSLHLPLTPETHRIIDAPELALMRPTSLLINTAHGRLIDEGALIKALRERQIAGAGLDVFAYEALPDDSPLISLDNVVLTPHIAGMSAERERSLIAERVAELLSNSASVD